MRRRRHTVEVIGMPFLDMISCAFGGVVVLYLITPSIDGTMEPFVVTRIVELRTENSAPFLLGARLPAASPAKGCFEENCPPEPNVVREWSRGQGRLTAVLADAAVTPTSLDVAILDGAGFYTKPCIIVRTEVEGQQRIIALLRSDGFRRRLNPFNDPSAVLERCP